MLNYEIQKLIKSYSTEEIEKQLNNIFSFAEEYKNALENELLNRSKETIKSDLAESNISNEAEPLYDEATEPITPNNEEMVNYAYDYVNDYSIESIDYNALQYIQRIVDNYKEYELVSFLEKYSQKKDSGLEPAIHYQAELCIEKLQKLGKSSIVDEILGEHKICKVCGSKIKRSSIFCEYCGEKTV